MINDDLLFERFCYQFCENFWKIAWIITMATIIDLNCND